MIEGTPGSCHVSQHHRSCGARVSGRARVGEIREPGAEEEREREREMGRERRVGGGWGGAGAKSERI